MIVLSGYTNPTLSEHIAIELGCPLGKIDRTVFRNGELKPRIISPLEHEDVVIVASLVYPVHEAIMDLLLLIDASKRSGAKTVTAIIPWLSYSLQNEVFLPGEPLSVEVFARMISAVPCSRVIFFHLHTTDELKFFQTPTVHVSSVMLFADVVKAMQGDKVIVAPDKGAVPYAQMFAKQVSLPFAYLDKTRDRNTGKVHIEKVNGDITEKTCIFIDDVINTGGTAADAAKALKDQGAKRIVFIATHGLFAGNAPKILEDSVIDEVIVTDSIPIGDRGFKKLTIVSSAKVFADVLK